MIVKGYVWCTYLFVAIKNLKGEVYEISFKTTKDAGCNSDR